MGLVGIPLSGSPICGSTNSSVSDDVVSFDEEELCIRWYQMGLLLPLAQSVSKLNQRRRSPVDWSLNTRRFLAEYIQQRYMLLPHFYTLLYQATVEGTPLVRPMFYQFPQDIQTFNNSEQFMIGDAIMVCPVTTPSDDSNSVSVTVYFPKGTWYDYYTGQLLVHNPSMGSSIVLMTPVSHLNIFVREAAAFVTQESGTSAVETRRNSYTVTTGFALEGQLKKSEGYLYVDDGTSRNPSAYDLVHFQFTESKFVMNVTYNEWAKGRKPDQTISTVIDRIRIYGIELSVPPKSKTNGVIVYDKHNNILEVSSLNFDWSTKTYFEYNFGDQL